MPTTTQEAQVIAAIVVKKLKSGLEDTGLLDDVPTWAVQETAVGIFRGLAEVAYSTDNYSLRQSIFMVAAELDPDFCLDNASLCKVMDRYHELQPEMSPQEFLGLNNEQWLEFTEGCQV
jgi:hypothetical protein